MMIPQAMVVLKRTVVGDGDCRDVIGKTDQSVSSNQTYNIRLTETLRLTPDDDFRSDCRNVSHCRQQQSFSV